jgi:uncharacterized protein YcbK (DUF882 family)
MNNSEPRSNETFEDWFARQNIRHFEADEFTSYFNEVRRGVKNSPPPREMWKLILPTLRIVDELRAVYGRPVVIVSSYRSPAYNAPINGSAKKSYHMRFQALDITVAGKTPGEVFAQLKQWRDQGMFKGGLGRYRTFVHIDTRGSNATWGL